jgi:outer membrane protein assembly factor BamB
MKRCPFFLVAVGVCLFSMAAIADDWPQWRGPQRNGISKETGLLQSWPKDGPKLLWQVKDVGDGYSTPAVVGDRLYLLANKGNDDEFLEALKVKDGTRVWSTRLGNVGSNSKLAPYPGARSTPTVDGEFIYALGSDGDLVCVKLSDGAEVWRKNLRSDFVGKPGLWAYAESPLVDGDVLVCTPGGDDATLVALDKKKGSVIWKCVVPKDEKAAYASIIIVEVGGIKQYVQFLQNGVVGVEAKTGKFLWRYDKTAVGSFANIPTPVARDGFVYTSTGKGGSGLVKLTAENGKVNATQVYFSSKLPNSIGGSVLLGDHLYGTNSNGLLCIEFTSGTEKWQDDCIGPGSVCFAGGRLYVHGEKGEMALVDPTPKAYREVGRFTPPGQPDRGKSKAWAYPVVANGRLYVRDLGVMWCYDVKDATAGK